MKKNIFFILFVLLNFGFSNGQCIRTIQFPNAPVTSNNSGLPQIITDAVSSFNFSKVSNLVLGVDYKFSCTLNGVDKYITVTDWDNNILAYGPSPLTVPAITSANVSLHYSSNAYCNSSTQNHTVTVTALFTCAPPINIAVTIISTTGAAFSWTAQGNLTAFETLVQLASDATPTAANNGIPMSGTATSVSNLLPGTAYAIYVRSSCDSEDSIWNSPIYFTTNCLPITTFNETFETTSIDVLPSCWSAVLSGSGLSASATIVVQDFDVASGTHAVVLDNNNSNPATSNVILISPNLSNLSAGTHRLKFFAKNLIAGSLQVGTINNTTNSATFSPLQEIAVTNSYQEFTIDFSNYSGTNTFIALRNNSDAFMSIYLDDIKWEAIPACPDVTNIEVTAIATEAVTLQWQTNPAISEWDLVYSTNPNAIPETLTPISPSISTTPETIISGLTANTTYYVYVRSNCPGTTGNGTWIGPTAFTTACLSVSTFEESLESTAVAEVPSCWSAVIANADTNAKVSVVNYQAFTGTNSIEMNNGYSDANATVMLVSPNLSNLSEATHRLRFYAKAYNAPTVQIGTVNTPNASGNFNLFQTVTLSNNYQEYMVDFTSYSGTDTFIVFKNDNSAVYTQVFLDNIRWEAILPCSDVTTVSLTAFTPNTATVSWQATGDEAQWDIVYAPETVIDPVGLTPISPAITGTPQATLTGLSPDTSYNVWVRSLCSDNGGTGAWIGPLKITTACQGVDNFVENVEGVLGGALPHCFSAILSGPTLHEFATIKSITYNVHSGSRCIQVYNAASGPNDNIMLVLPNLNTLATASHRLKFFAKTGLYDGAIVVGTLNASNSADSFTPFVTFTVGEDYAEYVIDFTTYTGTDTYIAIKNNSPINTNIYLDDFKWEVNPLCVDVSAIGVSSITTSTAALSWTSNGNEGQWDVVLGDASATDPSLLTSINPAVIGNPNTTLTGLSENTTYKVWVRSVCPVANGNGAFIGPILFTTQCIATTVPYLQNFESVTTPHLPTCTSVQTIGLSNSWETDNVTAYGFDSNVLIYNYTCDGLANTWYFTQGLALTQGVQYKLSYKYGNNTSPFYEGMAVAYGLIADASAMTQELANYAIIMGGAAQNDEVLFTPLATGVYYIGFNAISNSCQDRLFLDDISIDTSLDANSFTYNSFKSFPNPVKNILNITNNNAIASVSIFNLLGQKVLEQNTNGNQVQINLASLPSGTYLVKALVDNKVITTKIIKE